MIFRWFIVYIPFTVNVIEKDPLRGSCRERLSNERILVLLRGSNKCVWGRKGREGRSKNGIA